MRVMSIKHLKHVLTAASISVCEIPRGYREVSSLLVLQCCAEVSQIVGFLALPCSTLVRYAFFSSPKIRWNDKTLEGSLSSIEQICTLPALKFLKEQKSNHFPFSGSTLL